MDPIAFIVEKIYNIDSNSTKKYFIAYLGGILLLIIFIQGLFIYKMNTIFKGGKIILEKKDKIKKLLEEKDKIDSLKFKIDEILKKEAEFKLKDYVISSLQQKNFSQKLLSSSEIPREEAIKPGYKEVSMDLELQNISTLEIISILNLLEENPRVYLKDIEVNRTDSSSVRLKVNIAAIELS